jgi:hypothetical protein
MDTEPVEEILGMLEVREKLNLVKDKRGIGQWRVKKILKRR